MTVWLLAPLPPSSAAARTAVVGAWTALSVRVLVGEVVGTKGDRGNVDDGSFVGTAVGSIVGRGEGEGVGVSVGSTVGRGEGEGVGAFVGNEVGPIEGTLVGLVGSDVGCTVGAVGGGAV